MQMTCSTSWWPNLLQCTAPSTRLLCSLAKNLLVKFPLLNMCFTASKARTVADYIHIWMLLTAVLHTGERTCYGWMCIIWQMQMTCITSRWPNLWQYTAAITRLLGSLAKNWLVKFPMFNKHVRHCQQSKDSGRLHSRFSAFRCSVALTWTYPLL